MELIRWNQTGDMFSFRRRLHHLFDDVFRPVVRYDDRRLSQLSWNPAVDVYDNDENIVVKAELPGIDKKDIAIDVKNGVLTLKGERRFNREIEEEAYCRRERIFGRFERAFRLPAKVDSEQISANYKDGILTIDIPKPDDKKPKQVSVN